MCFYLPGLIYAINDLACRARIKVSQEKLGELTGEDYGDGAFENV